MKDKSCVLPLQCKEAMQIAVDLGLKTYPPTSVGRCVLVWEFVKQNEKGVNIEHHYFYTYYYYYYFNF